MSVVSQSVRTFFTGHNVATLAYIYNSNDGNYATSGWVSSKADHAVVQICIATLNASSITYRVEGKFDTLDRKADIYNETVATADSIDKLIVIAEHVKEIRVGVKCGKMVSSPLGSPCNFYAGIVLTELT